MIAIAIAVLAIGVGAAWWRGGGAFEPPRDDAPSLIGAAANGHAASAAPSDATSERAATPAREPLAGTGLIAVRVVDENGAPIAGARAIAASLSESIPGSTMESYPSTSPTDRDGRTVVTAVPEGRWFVRAEHERYLFSLFVQTSRAPVEVGAQPIDVTVVLVEPFVAGVAVHGAEVLANRFMEPSGRWDYLGDREVERLCQRLCARWSGAVFGVWVPQLLRPARVPDSTDVQLVIEGCMPWSGRTPVVRLGEFRGPMVLDAAQLTRSDEFGRVALRALDASGAPCAGVVVELQHQGDSGEQFSLAAGTERAVPAGMHVPQCTQPFVRQLLPPLVSVPRKATATIDMQGRILSHVMLVVEGPTVASRAQLRHSLLRDAVWLELHNGKQVSDYWIPEGTLEITWFGRERGVGLGDPGGNSLLNELAPLARSEEIAIGGGTTAVPQRLVVRPK